jgi:hypothetical protein
LDSITLNSSNGYIKFQLKEILGFPNETCYYGGYDILGEIEIKCDNYFVSGNLNFSTGNIFNFYSQLTELFNSLETAAKFDSYEHQLSFFVKVDKLGHIEVEGEYREDLVNKSRLIFEFEGDQSYLNDWLSELKRIVNKYGNNLGIINKAL